MSDLVRPGASPFDSIRREHDGVEYWSARELMPLLGYDQWRRFDDAISRARRSAQNVGANVTRHFADADNINDLGYRAKDYRLTRYAAYLIAMNGDPRKQEIADAQTYFAVKTREAETAPARTTPDLDTYEGKVYLLDLMREQVDLNRALELENARQKQEIETQQHELDETHAYVEHLEPDAEAFRNIVQDDGRDWDVRTAARFLCRSDRRITIGRDQMFAKLREWKLLDKWSEPYSHHKRYVTSIPKSYTHPRTGERIPAAKGQVRVTWDGLSYCRRRLLEEIEKAAAEKAAQQRDLFNQANGDNVRSLPARRDDDRPGGAA